MSTCRGLRVFARHSCAFGYKLVAISKPTLRIVQSGTRPGLELTFKFVKRKTSNEFRMARRMAARLLRAKKAIDDAEKKWKIVGYSSGAQVALADERKLDARTASARVDARNANGGCKAVRTPAQDRSDEKLENALSRALRHASSFHTQHAKGETHLPVNGDFLPWESIMRVLSVKCRWKVSLSMAEQERVIFRKLVRMNVSPAHGIYWNWKFPYFQWFN